MRVCVCIYDFGTSANCQKRSYTLYVFTTESKTRETEKLSREELCAGQSVILITLGEPKNGIIIMITTRPHRHRCRSSLQRPCWPWIRMKMISWAPRLSSRLGALGHRKLLVVFFAFLLNDIRVSIAISQIALSPFLNRGLCFLRLGTRKAMRLRESGVLGVLTRGRGGR